MSLNTTETKNMNNKESKSAEHHDFLQGQINAAEAIMRAAQFEIRSRKLPDVQKCQSSLSAWKQFCMYFNIWVKHLKTKREVNAEGKAVRVNDPLAYEGIGSYLKKSFGHWASMVGLEIWAVISLGFNWVFLFRQDGGEKNWVFVNIGKGAGFVGLQVSRFFQWIKKRNYWNSLKWNMQLREFKKRFDIWREKKRVEHHERAVNRQVLAVERETQRKEEAARKAAVRKEEEAIRQARLEEAAALKHTQEIEAEIAAIALRRKQEEQRVHEQIQRKEEAQKLLQEARETEEKERAVFEAQRQEQEKAREEAARQAEEAKARLEVLRKEDEERKRLAAAREEELKRLKEEEERLAEEKRLAEVKRLEDEKKLEEAKAAAEKQAAEAQLKPSFAQKRQAEIEQRSELAKEEIRIQEEAEEKEEQLRLEKEQQEAQEKEKAEQERLRAQEIKAQEEQEREAEETAKRLHKEAEEKRLQELEAKREQEEAEYLKKRAAEPVKTSQPKPALAAAAVRSAVKSIPVSMPSVSIPDAQARERMMTDARDRTSNFIRRTIIRSEINSVIGNPAEAVKLTALKFAIIGLVRQPLPISAF